MSLLTSKPPAFLAVVGPTASGKSAASMKLASELGGEIVCCDSVQLYRGFDIGSAKPTKEDCEKIPHHLFGAFEWNEDCDAGVYADRAKLAIEDIRSRNRVPIITGGTGLYLRALVGSQWDGDLPKDEVLRESLKQRSSEDLFAELKAIDPKRAEALHPNDRFRVIRALEINRLTGKPVRQTPKPHDADRDYVVVVLEPPRAALQEKISERTKAMFSSGFIEEVRSLLAGGVAPTCKPMQSIGYYEVAQFLSGSLSEDQLVTAVETATRQYAKRQSTWFRKIPRDYCIESAEGLETVVRQLRQSFA